MIKKWSSELLLEKLLEELLDTTNMKTNSSTLLTKEFLEELVQAQDMDMLLDQSRVNSCHQVEMN